MDRDEARALDLVAAAALASPVVAGIGGWRCASDPDGPFRRANAALPGPEAGADAAEDRRSLALVRDWYRPRAQRLLVQVSDAHQDPEALDALLADAGLAVEAPVVVLVADSPPVAIEVDPSVAVSHGIDEAWAAEEAVLASADDVQARRVRGYGRIFAAHRHQALGAVVRHQGAVVGVGFGVVDEGWLGIFGMATDPARRRQGVASRIVAALWAAAGVGGAYLQVEQDNEAATSLYRSLGFTPHHRYHYRSEGRAPDTEGC